MRFTMKSLLVVNSWVIAGLVVIFWNNNISIHLFLHRCSSIYNKLKLEKFTTNLKYWNWNAFSTLCLANTIAFYGVSQTFSGNLWCWPTVEKNHLTTSLFYNKVINISYNLLDAAKNKISGNWTKLENVTLCEVTHTKKDQCQCSV